MNDAPFSPQRFAVGSGEFILGLNLPSSVDRISRGALVLDGIQPSELALNLSSVLASKGGFSYQPYPHPKESIQDSITALLSSANTFTALLYLKGRFITTDGVGYFVFNDGQKFSKEWLAQQLADSAVEQQIIILDCRQTPQIDRQIELFKQPNKSQCIVAASTDNDWLGNGFLEIINNSSLKGLTGTNLIDRFSRAFYARGILSLEQRVFYRSDKGIINVILPPAQQLSNVVIDRNYCPYKGLEAFTSGDRNFFFGRENLIQEIIARLETDSFVPVVGASGSGKSSIVQAGVIPQLLEEGLFIPQDNRCKSCLVWNLRPGEKPLQALANALCDRQNNSDILEGILHLGVESFVAWLRRQPQPMGVLVIDQFEELFTQASEVNRNQFLELILGGIKYAGDRFKVVITLRNDFMTSCLAIPELGEIVKQNPLFVPSYLTQEQYRQIIVAPATRVGLAVQPELVDVLISEVSTEKGALPLLEFTLERLWQNRVSGQLSLRVYQEKIGGIKKVLQERADSTYKQLIAAQQECAQWIFTQLVSLGEGQEDTRRRRYLSELIVPKYSQELITSTLNALRNSRLIVMSDREGDAITSQQTKAKTKETNHKSEPLKLSLDSEVTIEIAHEILIRNWQQLRWWLDENREQIRLRERIEAKAAEWQISGQKTDYLIRGAALAQAEEFYLKYADELPETSQRFIYNSIEERDKQAKLAKRRRRQLVGSLIGGIATLSMLAGAALWQLRRATINEINALNNSAEALLASNQQLDALVTGLKARKKLKNSWFGIPNKTDIKTLASLQNTLYEIKEINRLESHTDDVTEAAWSPDGQILASTHENTIKLWSTSGKLLHSLNSYGKAVWSPNGKMIASSHGSEIELWSISGELLHSFGSHKDRISTLQWSPDGQILTSTHENTIKLWNVSGQLLHSFQVDEQYGRDIAWSPDGQILASTDTNTVKLWSVSGKLLHSFQVDGFQIDGFQVRQFGGEIAWSPDGQILAFNSKNTVKLWNVSGELLHSFGSHKDRISTLQWSPDGQILTSTDKNTVKLWNVSGELLHSFQVDGQFGEKIVWSPDSQILAFREKNAVKLWNVSGELLHSFQVNEQFIFGEKIAWSPDSQILAYASQDRAVKLWSASGKLLDSLEGHTDAINKIAWSPDGLILASVSEDKVVRLWNVQKELLHSPENHKGHIYAIQWSPDSQIIASASGDGTIKLSSASGNLLHSLEGHTDLVSEVVWSPDGQILASTSKDETVKLWSASGKLLHSLEGHTNWEDLWLKKASWSPDSQMLASASGDGTIKLWSSVSGKLLHSFKGHTGRVRKILWSPDGKSFTSAGMDDQTIKLWNVSGKLLYSFEESYSHRSGLSPNGQIVASAESDGIIKLRSVSGQLIHSFKAHTGSVRLIGWSPDGKIITRTNNETTKIWDVSGTLLYSIKDNMEPPDEKSWSSSGNAFVSANDEIVKIWNGSKNSFYPLEDHTNRFSNLAWNPNGQILAFANMDGTVSIWTVFGNFILSFDGHTDRIFSSAYADSFDYIDKLQWSSDGKTLAYGTKDGILKIWDFSLDDATTRSCNWVRDYLTNNPNVSEEDKKICDGIE